MTTLRLLVVLTGVAAMALEPAVGIEPAPKPGSPAENRKATVSQLIERMREKLPPGWTVKLVRGGMLLEFQRAEEALVYGESVALRSAPADKASWPSSRQSIQFWMLVDAFPSQDILDHMAAKNAPALQKMVELKDRLAALRQSYEANPALKEKGVAILKAYQTLWDGLMCRSQFSFQGVITLNYYQDCGLTPPLEPRIVDDGVRAEYRKVCQDIEGLLTPFCPERPPLLR